MNYQPIFDNEIDFPDGRVGWNWDLGTLADEDPSTPGENGSIDVMSKWEWRVPKWALSGEYTIFARAYNHLGPGNRPYSPNNEKKMTLVVL